VKNTFNSYLSAIVAILLSVTVMGGAVVFTKMGVNQIPPFTFVFLRFAIASVCVLPFFLKNLPKIDRDFYKVLLFSAILSYNVTAFAVGVKLTTATISQVIYVFSPILVVVLSYFLLSERLSSQKIFGVILGFIGTVLVVLLPEISKGNVSAGNLTGNLILVTAVIATSSYNTLSKKFQRKYSPMQLTAIFIFTTTIILAFFSLFDLISHPSWWTHLSPSAVWEVGYVGVLGTVLYYFLNQFIIKRASPFIASLMFYLQPLLTFVWAYFLLGEQLTSGLIFGALLTFAGVFLILTRRKIRNLNLEPV
jgi:drug/metabolite transporter (DMT)-like permease